MFNLVKATKNHIQYLHDKEHGLPERPKNHDKLVEHISASTFDEEALQESLAMDRAYKSRTTDFGKRLSKARGQQHRVGGFANKYIV